jgi:hypothetical protein
MGRHCSVCTHPQRNEIDLAVLLHQEGFRVIAARYKVAATSLQRHEAKCLRTSWELSKGLNAMLQGETLLDELGKWHQKMLEQYGHADAAGNIMAAVATARTGIQAIESFSHIAEKNEVAKQLEEIQSELEEVRERLDSQQGEVDRG